MDEKTLQIIRENRALGIEEEMEQDRGYRWRVFSSPAALVEFLNNTNMEILDICSKASSGWTTTIIYTLIYRED